MRVLILACAFLGCAYAASTNLDSLQQIADEVNRLQTTWKAESNIPSHVTVSSFMKLFGVKKTGLKLPSKPKSFRTSNNLIPEEFDSRKQWPNCPTISHISDQGRCGSCWAVASAGALSDRVCIASNGTFTSPLSVEELMTCCSACGDGCHGGDPLEAWHFFYTHGLVTGGDYGSNVGCQPYSVPPCEHNTEGSLPQCSSQPKSEAPECKEECTNPTYKKRFYRDHVMIKKAYSLVEASVERVQEDILNHGPVVAVFTIFSDFLTYKSGVYQYVTGNIVSDHAVRVIGWGTENGTPYWLVANSLNTNWGEKGFFKIRRGTNECGFEERMAAGLP